jgi:hypothetical protein
VFQVDIFNYFQLLNGSISGEAYKMKFEPYRKNKPNANSSTRYTTPFSRKKFFVSVQKDRIKSLLSPLFLTLVFLCKKIECFIMELKAF